MNNNIITQDDVAYVSRLARVAVSNEEEARYQAQLAAILGYIAKLNEAETDGVPPTFHPLSLSNVWREDRADPFPDVASVLRNAPERDETFYRVKKVIG